MSDCRIVSEPTEHGDFDIVKPAPDDPISLVRAYATREDTLAASSSEDDLGTVREQLPRSLVSWRLPQVVEGGTDESARESVWKPLYPFFKKRGYTFWKHFAGSMLYPDVEEDANDLPPTISGFAYATRHGGLDSDVGSLNQLTEFMYANPLCRAARTADGRDVVVRVLAVGKRGQEHVDILQVISQGPYAFFEDNHGLPLFETFDFEDITFGVFPKVGFRVEEMYNYWAQNSVGDIVDIILQCLEALAFIHSLSIAHRDAFKDNFLVQWYPESLKSGHAARSKPRVFLTDFEVAVMFPHTMPLEDCLVVGYPTGGSYPDDIKQYVRDVPPEVTSGEPYDPFKLDVWQFGTSLSDFKSTIPEIDRILDGMRLPDAGARLSSFDALEYLSRALADLTPKALMIPPDTIPLF